MLLLLIIRSEYLRDQGFGYLVQLLSSEPPPFPSVWRSALRGSFVPFTVVAHIVAVLVAQRSWGPALNVVPEPRSLSVRRSVLTVIYVLEREIRHELLLFELAGLWVLDDPILRIKVSNDIYGPLQHLICFFYIFDARRLSHTILGARRRCSYGIEVMRVVGRIVPVHDVRLNVSLHVPIQRHHIYTKSLAYIGYRSSSSE